MKASEVRAKSDAELRDECANRREEIWRLTFQGAVGQLEDASLLRRARRDVARILTVLRERELAARTKADEVLNQEKSNG